ncbi:hypothetical protein ACWD4N_42480 [Streptomyces sp. NPDC002586]
MTEEQYGMPKKRTTAQQRARELQHANGSTLPYGQLLQQVRRRRSEVPRPDETRTALAELANASDLSTTWQERFTHHLAASHEDGWPAEHHAHELFEDLHIAVGAPIPGPNGAVVPRELRYFPLSQVERALRAGNAADLACALVAAFEGALRHLLRHSRGRPASVDDLVYRIRRAPTRAPRHQLTIHTPEDLYFDDVPYPRPWGTPLAYGFFRTTDIQGRDELARALLAHALGGAEPTSLAACTNCQGNGLLSALNPDHSAHIPAYRSDRTICICGECRGSGLRTLPARDFAEEFLSDEIRTTPDAEPWAIARSSIITWASPRLLAQPRPSGECRDGLQAGYIAAVAATLLAAGFTVDGSEQLAAYELDFDDRGGLGGHFYVGGHPCLAHEFGASRLLMCWYSDRGWTVTGFGDSLALLPGQPVPEPAAVLQALLQRPPVIDPTRPPLVPRDIDVYTEVLAYVAR